MDPNISLQTVSNISLAVDVVQPDLRFPSGHGLADEVIEIAVVQPSRIDPQHV
jgi:hypothetical protein